jgi:hypothetical protein
MSLPTVFPLQVVTTGDLGALCHVLWGWELCDNCLHATSKGLSRCGVALCSCAWGRRAERLEPFFEFYRQTTRPYVPDFFGDHDQAIRSHRDLLDILVLIKSHGTDRTRGGCMAEYFGRRSGGEESLVPQSDQDRAFELAARIMTMTHVSCEKGQDIFSAETSWDVESKQSDLCPQWREQYTLPESLDDLFMARIHPSLQNSDPQSKLIRETLTAVNLKKMAGLKIESTNNLHHHLKLNPSTGTVQIFHHTTFLKEHLLATLSTRHLPGLSRKLALETICTIQLLFPPENATSQSLLRNLVSKDGFDPDCLRFGTASFELPGSGEKERAMRFPTWGTRLMHLYDEIENPKPRGRVEAWLERRSKSRHVMMVTMIGVLTAVLLGLFGLCLSIFQTWIAWRQWKDGGNP